MSDDVIQSQLTFLIANALNDALALGLSDDLGGEVIHIGSSLPQEFNLSIANSLTVGIEIEGQGGSANSSNFHFHIKFVDNECFFNASSLTLQSANWSMDVEPKSGFVTDIYLLSSEDITLAPGSSAASITAVNMEYTNAFLANPKIQMLQIGVTVGDHVWVLLDPRTKIIETETLHLSAFTDAGTPTPLIAKFVQRRTLLADGTEGDLLLRLVNSSPEPVVFASPSGKNAPTATAIGFAVDIDSAAAWALCKPDESKLITVIPPANWNGDPAGVVGTGQKTWLFRPDYSKATQIPPNSALEFQVTGIKTTLPPGFTNFYVFLQEFPEYGTQTLVTQIEKSPLIYNKDINSGLLTQGTTGNTHALAINGTTAVDLLSAEQIGAGASAHFKGGSGVNIENGLAVSAGTSGQRKVLSVKGGMALGSTFAGISMMNCDTLLVEGAIGIGTLAPGSSLAVSGGVAIGVNYSWNGHATPNTLLVEGAVGIGTPTPSSWLSVIGGTAIGTNFAVKNVAPPNTLLVEGAIGIGTPTPRNPLTVRGGATIGSGLVSTASPDEGLLVQGHVGIGSTQPQSKLSVSGGGVAIGSYADSTAAPLGGLTVEGNVGIGTPSPTKGKLHVVGAQLDTPGANFAFYAYRNNMSSPYTGLSGGGIYNGIWADNRIVAIEFDAFSDARMKNISGSSDGAQDLATLMSIEITDYTFKDTMTRGDRPHKKVIGQQLRKVFEQAVSVSSEVVPDIFQQATSIDGWIDLTATLQVGERIKVLPENDGEVFVKVTDIEANRFRVSPSISDGSVFVYGREVDDFLHVDYDAIAMLNVSATQELKREKDADVKALRDENAALRTRLDQLEKLIEDLTLADASVNR